MRYSFVAAIPAFLSLSAHAAKGLNFDFSADMGDAAYKNLLQPIINPMRYMFAAPANGTGLLGFDLGVAATVTELPKQVLDIASSYVSSGKDIPETLAFPRLTVQKGLPFGLDLGVNTLMIPGTNIKLLGAAMQYQIDLPVPALPVYAAVRGGYTTLLGLKELEASHLNIEGLASLGLPAGLSAVFNVEPWIGVGVDFADAKSKLSFSAADIAQELTRTANWTEKYAFGGLRLSLGFIRLGFDAQYSLNDLAPLYTIKGGIGF
jgi:hypothetical protein